MKLSSIEKKELKFKAIDLYSGIGGWTLGMKMSGIEPYKSYEYWVDANYTHNLNFNKTHPEIDIRKIELKSEFQKFPSIDFVVGSPPCTQFSYANRGGSGNINDGLVDVKKFLDIVDHLKPKFWAMENVPRVKSIIERELMEGGQLSIYKHLFKDAYIEIVNSADYGVPQKRKRMIAGQFPSKLFDGYKSKIRKTNLNDVLKSLNGKNSTFIDINYQNSVAKQDLTDHVVEEDLTSEEVRINRDSKTYHPVYNKMSFPEKLDLPARTITATCTRVSRESIIVESTKGFRRLTVRERATIQGFPLSYQFYGRTYNSKLKMIGNAVPPPLTYYIFQSMQGTPVAELKCHYEIGFNHPVSNTEIPYTPPEKSKRSFTKTRKFRFAVPNLRFGSGMRFELSNEFKNKEPIYSFKFYYGNSKSIQSLILDSQTLSYISNTLKENLNQNIKYEAQQLLTKFDGPISSKSLQEHWVNEDENSFLFNLVDEIGDSFDRLLSSAPEDFNYAEELSLLTQSDNKKLLSNAKYILIGFLLLTELNKSLLT